MTQASLQEKEFVDTPSTKIYYSSYKDSTDHELGPLNIEKESIAQKLTV